MTPRSLADRTERIIEHLARCNQKCRINRIDRFLQLLGAVDG